MKNRRKDSGIAIDVALIVLLLAVFSSLFASGFLAKYRTGGDNTDSARVAKWKVSAAAGPLEENTPGEHSYEIKVFNRSETAVEYGITIKFTESVKNKLKDPQINGQAPAEGTAFTDTLTFEQVGTLPAASESSPASTTVNLTFLLDEDFLSSITGGEDYDNNVISNAAFDIPFSVHIDVVQMD